MGERRPERDARLKADVAFEFFDLLGVPFFCFHDRDIAPEGDTLAESNRNVHQMAERQPDAQGDRRAGRARKPQPVAETGRQEFFENLVSRHV